MTQDIIRMAREAGLRSAVLLHMWGKEDALCDSEIEELRQIERFAELVRADEREACAEKTGEFARKWWSIHCESNKHMETTLKAHQDFCVLQAAIRARGKHEH
jgi:hypothetical protein